MNESLELSDADLDAVCGGKAVLKAGKVLPGVPLPFSRPATFTPTAAASAAVPSPAKSSGGGCAGGVCRV